jgi:hypothetical protein
MFPVVALRAFRDRDKTEPKNLDDADRRWFDAPFVVSMPRRNEGHDAWMTETKRMTWK